MNESPDQEKKKKGIESPWVHSWMLVLGLFWLFRFWSLKEEAWWLFTLNVYKGDETVDLVTVSLGKDGMLCLLAAIFLLWAFSKIVFRHFKKNQVQPVGAGQPDNPPVKL